MNSVREYEYEREVELADYLVVLLGNWPLIAGVTLLCALGTWGASMRQESSYEARAIMYMASQEDFGPPAGSKDAGSGAFLPLPVIKGILATREPESFGPELLWYYSEDGVEAKARDALIKSLNIERQASGNIVVTATSSDPHVAAGAANAFVNAVGRFLRERRGRKLAVLSDSLRALEARIDRASKQLLASVQMNAAAPNTFTAQADTSEQQENLRRLKQQWASYLAERQDIERRAAVDVETSYAAAEAVDKLGSATKKVAIAGIVGLMGSVMLAFLREYVSRSGLPLGMYLAHPRQARQQFGAAREDDHAPTLSPPNGEPRRIPDPGNGGRERRESGQRVSM